MLLKCAIALVALAQPALTLRVVVAGATGKVGRELIRILRRQAVPATAITRDVLRAKRLMGVNTPCCVVDFDAEGGFEALTAALPEDEPFRLFVATPNGPQQAAWETALFSAAAARGCEHVVKISTATAVLDRRVGPHAAHREAEAALEGACPSFTILRPAPYMQTLFSPDDEFLGLPSGGGDGSHLLADSRIAMVSAVDVAAVAARMLVADDVTRCPKLLELTGPEAATVSHAVRVAAGGCVTPRPIDGPLEAFLEVLASDCSRVTNDVFRATGEAPRRATSFFQRELRRRALNSGTDGRAYNNRATWTANYRGLLPFDEVRRKTRGMGLRSEAEYREVGVPKYSPSRPADMFPDEWLGWDDFLGVRRKYADGRHIARTLGISSELRWYTYAIENSGVLADLRLPFRPPQAYKDDWRGWEDWLGLPPAAAPERKAADAEAR